MGCCPEGVISGSRGPWQPLLECAFLLINISSACFGEDSCDSWLPHVLAIKASSRLWWSVLHVLAGAGHENAALDGIRSRRWVSRGDGPTAQKLLMKLRWCTLGPQFDWTARVYDREHPYRPLPAQLHALACRLALSAAKFLPDRAGQHMDALAHSSPGMGPW